MRYSRNAIWPIPPSRPEQGFQVITTALFAIALCAFEALRTVPQAIRLFRTRNTQGLSEVAITLRVVSGLGWVVYAALQHAIAAFAAAVVFQVFMIVIARGYHLVRGLTFRSWLPAVPLGLLLLISVQVGGMYGETALLLGLLLNASVLVWGTPQLLTALRSDRLSGHSPIALGVTLLDGLVYGVIGIMTADVGFTLYAVITALLTAPVLVRYYLVEIKSRPSGVDFQVFTASAQPDLNNAA